MGITFNDLKEKHLKLGQTQWKLREKLQGKACELVREYSESLSLPSDVWKDSEGNEHPYVEIGVWKKPGEFESVSLPRLPMDENYTLNFVISTTLDDSPLTGGHRHGVSVALHYDNVVLCASVGSGDDTAYFNVSPNPGGFYEVCGAIKALINTAIVRETPKAYIN